MRDWLATLAREFYTVKTDEELFQVTTNVAKKELGADKCLVAVASENVLIPKASSPPSIGCSDSSLHIKASIPGQVYANNEPYLLDDIRDIRSTVNPQAVNLPRNEYRSLLIVPFEEVGILMAVSNEPSQFSEDDLEKAQKLTTYGAGILERTSESSEGFEFPSHDQSEVQRIADSIPDGVIAIGDDLHIRLINREFADLTGHTKTELRKTPIWEVFDDDTVELIADNLDELRNDPNMSIQSDTICETKQGDNVPVQGKFSRRSVYRQFSGIIGVLRETSQLKRTVRELRNDVEQYEEFACVISHDLQNPLNVAQGRIELARNECENENLEAASSALNRIEEIIEESLRLARSGQSIGEMDYVDPAPLAKQSWENIDSSVGELEIGQIPEVKAHSERLQHLFENLFGNAAEHGHDNVSVRVGGINSGFYVEDDGPGIPENIQDAIFESGFNTRENGTGLGLSIVKRIVVSHGWDITVTDSDRGGARFEITGVEIRN